MNTTIQTRDLTAAIRSVVEGHSLSHEEAREVAEAIMEGSVSSTQIAALLVALRMKGESVDEIRGFAGAMRDRATKIQAPPGAVDPCGTGGDNRGDFNVSTTVAFVAAAAGCKIAKHGNRSVSSKCGSSEVLEALGVDPALDPEAATAQLNKFGLCFLFAPRYHGATKHAVEPRRAIGVRSIFNLVGPLTNPALVRRQLLGVFDAKWTEPLAEVLRELGSEHCLVVHGHDGMDEISITDTTRVSELKDGTIRTYTFDPRELGFNLQPAATLRGGEPADNAAIIRTILEGRQGAPRDVVVLNAAATLYVGGQAESIEDGVSLAERAIDDGSAAALLEEFRHG